MKEKYQLILPKTKKPVNVCVALSGGVDSVVLTHLCIEAYKTKKIKNLRALHINHGLNLNADEWQQTCIKYCKKYNIPIDITQVIIKKTSRKGLECIARDARYLAFSQKLKPDEYLFQGHHQNDQAETVLFRAVRGGDSSALSAIPMQRNLNEGFIFRPLIEKSREWIIEYAKLHKLSWIEDDSNLDICFDRNYIRHKVIPVLKQRWPNAITSLAKVANENFDASELLDDLAKIDLNKIEQKTSIPLLGKTNALNIKELQTITQKRQLNVFKFWLKKYNIIVPSKKQLPILIKNLLNAANDKHPIIDCKNTVIRRWNNWIIITKKQPCDFNHEKYNFIISLPFKKINIPELNLSLNIKKMVNSESAITNNLNQLRICFRNSVSVKPFIIKGRKGTKTLKKWLNEYKVPFWIKDNIPLLCCDEELVTIPGLFINDKFASRDKDSGWDVDCTYTNYVIDVI